MPSKDIIKKWLANVDEFFNESAVIGSSPAVSSTVIENGRANKPDEQSENKAL